AGARSLVLGLVRGLGEARPPERRRERERSRDAPEAEAPDRERVEPGERGRARLGEIAKPRERVPAEERHRGLRGADRAGARRGKKAPRSGRGWRGGGGRALLERVARTRGCWRR